MKFSELGKDELPREKLLSSGPRSLSDAELLAILMHTGTSRMNVIDVSRTLLAAADHSLINLSEMSFDRVCEVNGIGVAKAATLTAAIELGRRLACQLANDPRPVINNAQDAASVLRGLYTTDVKEECWCLFLKRSRRLLDSLKISEGGETLTEINVRRIVRKALDCGAVAVILSHNHPSGDPRPSTADIRLTNKLRQALSTFEITLTDHIIVSENSCYSFCESGVF